MVDERGRKKDPLGKFEEEAFRIYKVYFGPNWREELERYLLIEVRDATLQDWFEVNGQPIGWINTKQIRDKRDKALVQNIIRIYSPPDHISLDFPLRTEIGESLYNLLESIALQSQLGSGRLALPPTLASKITSHQVDQDFLNTLPHILDKWNDLYTQNPSRYYGIDPNYPRDYQKIPIWKSEGFSDAVAIGIRRKSGLPIDSTESNIWQTFDPKAQKLIETCIDTFLPPVVTR